MRVIENECVVSLDSEDTSVLLAALSNYLLASVETHYAKLEDGEAVFRSARRKEIAIHDTLAGIMGQPDRIKLFQAQIAQAFQNHAK